MFDCWYVVSIEKIENSVSRILSHQIPKFKENVKCVISFSFQVIDFRLPISNMKSFFADKQTSGGDIRIESESNQINNNDHLI